MDSFSVRLADSAVTDRLVRLVSRHQSEVDKPLSPEQAQLLQEIAEDPAWGRAWLAVQGQRDVGYATLYFYISFEVGGRMALLGHLFVLPEERRRGLGRMLLSRMVSEAAAAGCRGIAVRTDGANWWRALYESLGFLPLRNPADIMVLGFGKRSPLT